jgi:hypothetical protein
MRTDLKVATLSLAVLVGACSAGKERSAALPDDLQKDLAVASAAAPGLATAPQAYKPMEVVSSVERARTAAPAKRPGATKRRTPPAKRAVPVSRPAEDVIEEPTVATTVPTPIATEAPEPIERAPMPDPEPQVIAQQPSDAPAPVGGGNEGDAGIGQRRGGGGLGGILGGIIGAVVIRGGHGGVDKCDPRTDGRRRGRGGIILGRPDFGLPLPTGTTFPRSR